MAFPIMNFIQGNSIYMMKSLSKIDLKIDSLLFPAFIILNGFIGTKDLIQDLPTAYPQTMKVPWETMMVQGITFSQQFC